MPRMSLTISTFNAPREHHDMILPGAELINYVEFSTEIDIKYHLECQAFLNKLKQAGLVYTRYGSVEQVKINGQIFNLSDPDVSLEDIFEAGIQAYKLPRPAFMRKESINHYIGIPLVESDLAEHIYNLTQSTDNNNINWTWPTGLHFTLGWFGTQDLTQEQLERLNTRISPIVANMKQITIKLVKLEITTAGRIIIHLENDPAIVELRQALEKECKDLNIPFLYANPHIEIGYLAKADSLIPEATLRALQKNFNNMTSRYNKLNETFENISILHYASKLRKLVTDFTIPLLKKPHLKRSTIDIDDVIANMQGTLLRSYSSTMTTSSPGTSPTMSAKPVSKTNSKYDRFRKDPVFEPIPEEYLDNMDIFQSEEYKKSMLAMESSAAKYASSLITSTPENFSDVFTEPKSKADNGLILRFATLYSQRYLDLMEAAIAYEMAQGIPMLDFESGKMKAHGFTSQDIIQMQPGCIAFIDIIDALTTQFGTADKELMKNLIKIMLDTHPDLSLNEFMNHEPPEWLGKFTDTQLAVVKQLFNKYANLDPIQIKHIKLAQFLMENFAHMNTDQIVDQLRAVANQKHNQIGLDSTPEERTNRAPNAERRLLMEVRHRIAGDGTFITWGSMGSNPQAYLNVVRSGVKVDPQADEHERELAASAEFRGKMFFAYMLNHFANSVIQTPEKIIFINKWLKDNNKGWQIDYNLAELIKDKGPSYLPPVFRYGPRAALNSKFARRMLGHVKQIFFYENLSEKTLSSLDEIGYKPTVAEQLAFTGSFARRGTDPGMKLPKFGSGAGLFRVPEFLHSNMNLETQEYISALRAFSIPSVAGISGTLDQSIIMAGLVGLGLNNKPDLQEKELQSIKLAFMAFMLPNNDHSLNEILDSSTSFGLAYGLGPDFVQYINPEDPKAMEFLSKQQAAQGTELPSVVFSSLRPRRTPLKSKEQNT